MNLRIEIEIEIEIDPFNYFNHFNYFNYSKFLIDHLFFLSLISTRNRIVRALYHI